MHGVLNGLLAVRSASARGGGDQSSSCMAWRWWKLHRHPWRLEKRDAARRPHVGTRHPASGPEHPDPSLSRGQFIWMTEGRAARPRSSTIPSPSPTARNRPGLSLIIKEAGDFTRTIGSIPPGTPSASTGLWRVHAFESHECDAVLLLAGGVGIAPIMGLLRDLAASGDTRPVRLAYAAGIPENFAASTRSKPRSQGEPGYHLRQRTGRARIGQALSGALDRDRLDQDASMGLDRKRTVAFICGPGPMGHRRLRHAARTRPADGKHRL